LKNKSDLYRPTNVKDTLFPIEVVYRNCDEFGFVTSMHWHEHIQIYEVINGVGFLHCNSKKYDISQGDILIINPNELHRLENVYSLAFRLITVNLSFISSSKYDSCQLKYLEPIINNQIIFRNYVNKDIYILTCIHAIFEEYTNRSKGFELAIKAQIYNFIVLLLRKDVYVYINEKESIRRTSQMIKYQKIFEYIEEHISENLDISTISKMFYISDSHFCRIFKQITGKTFTEYINILRIEIASRLLLESELSITEIAYNCGFNDANYFSRLIKKYKKMAPTKLRTSLRS
jgi:AraC-like DNA-binding protein